jgi:Mlc titration factor MtfA (ptsG expression regulator)
LASQVLDAELVRDSGRVARTVVARIALDGEELGVLVADDGNIEGEHAAHALVMHPLRHRLDAVPGRMAGRMTVALMDEAVQHLLGRRVASQPLRPR